MPGSVNAYRLWISQDRFYVGQKMTYGSQHARDRQQGHVHCDDGNRNALVFPPPHSSRAEVDTSDGEYHRQ